MVQTKRIHFLIFFILLLLITNYFLLCINNRYIFLDSKNVLKHLLMKTNSITNVTVLNDSQKKVAYAKQNEIKTSSFIKISKRTQYALTLESPYIINNPSICVNVTNLKFLIIVHSATTNVRNRRIIRETWANRNIFPKFQFRTLFFFGIPKNQSIQKLIEKESVVNGDIVQGNFLDPYHNLTHKGVLAFRWIHECCQEAERTVFLNVFILMDKFYPKLISRKRSVLCPFRKKRTIPIHRRKTNWVVDKKIFRGYVKYPFDYCMGYLVLISSDLIYPLYQAAYITPFFWLDDLYLFGMIHGCYTKTKNCSYLAVLAGKKIEAVEKMWFAAVSQLGPEMKNEVNPVVLYHNVTSTVGKQ